MTLIKSISGMRGTIGGFPGTNLTPIDIVEMTSAYGRWLLDKGAERRVVLGRDGRISGSMVSEIATQTLLAMGIDIIDLGLSTTPTVEMAVPHLNAGGGIIFTASHNPREWNALKLLNNKGEFISAQDGEDLLKIADNRDFSYSDIDNLGTYSRNNEMMDYHISAILGLPYINNSLIRKQGFKVVVDCINSTGAIAIPLLLDKLGCEYTLINEKVDGEFAHNPEPLAKNLAGLAEKVLHSKAQLGIAVDPDVDRLVFMNEDGQLFGEEYTLVAVADFILSINPGATVSNLSSTRALGDVSKKYGQSYYASAVGEVNVVEKMKEVNAVIGGEGNGGVILPDLHYGRDALAGIALMLNHLAEKQLTMSALKSEYPEYHIVKEKVNLSESIILDDILNQVRNSYLEEEINEVDGLKIDFKNGWVHLRKSNTEPIIRIIAESSSISEANKLVDMIKVYFNGKP
ncbi:MAG: phosphoglucosamine mutase [Bacteroidia bacterium]|nr:phosphoglucosamine mutase [Bacteroidia bacterium]